MDIAEGIRFFVEQICQMENVLDFPNMPFTTFVYDHGWTVHFWYRNERGVLSDASIRYRFDTKQVIAEIGACTDYRSTKVFGSYSMLNNTVPNEFELNLPVF